MAKAGAAVAVLSRSAEGGVAVCREIEEAGGTAQAVECDVVDEASVAAAKGAVLARFGTVDVVVANAGVAGPTKPLEEVDYDEWRSCLLVNVDGVFLTFRAFLPSMLEAGRGSLIAISSVTGKRPLAGRTPYATSKMGIIGLVRTLASEVGPRGIRVNAVCPGAVTGPRIQDVLRQQALAQGTTKEVIARQFTDAAALRRFVDEEEVASACVFLASDQGSAITGEDLNVAAGLIMY